MGKQYNGKEEKNRNKSGCGFSKQELHKLIYLLSKNVSVKEICRIFNVDRRELLIKLNLLEDSYYYELQKGSLLLLKKLEFEDYDISCDDGLVKFMIVSDTHIGLKGDRLDLLNYAYEEAAKKGVKIVFHGGDIIEGCKYPNNLRVRNPQDQIDICVDKYPFDENITTYFITGNHEENLYQSHGLDVGLILDELRSDMVYLGFSEASIKLNDAGIFLFHGSDLNKTFNDYSMKAVAKELIPYNYDFLIRGHSHDFGQSLFNNTHCIQVPSLCESNKSLEFYMEPNIGIIFVEYRKVDGLVCDYNLEFKNFQRKRNR